MHKDLDRPANKGFLVLDFGSQYTLLIARKLRELFHYAEIVDGQATTPPKDFDIEGIILSGGPDSVYHQGSRLLPDWVLSSGKPVLGICYGMQLLVESHGGKIQSESQREYGEATVHLTDVKSPIGQQWLRGMNLRQKVWMSHGDSASHLESFDILGRTADGAIAAIAHHTLPLLGVQFHPEVHHTDNGKEFLRGFLEHVCKARPNWSKADRLHATIDHVKTTVGSGKVLMAVSGGVDSTVAIQVMNKALGASNVQAVFIDNGLLRKDEARLVEDNYRALGIDNLATLHRQDVFLKKLEGVTDPEKKRKIIGNTFIEEFEKFANDHHDEFTHLGQGTLYPDVIESAGHGAGSKVIKSHHNVGGLPDRLNFDLVEPFRYLFKDEVRQIGLALDIPHDMIFRHPFPGPGLAVRVLEEITQEKLNILKEADHIFISALKEADLYKSVWQAFVVLLPVRTVGVMGDNRTYERTCVLRAVTATDGMTASASNLPFEFLTKVSDQIVRKVSGINRVVYDITSKPPSTIEWE